MSDENNQPFFNIQRIYLKDMSLEQPNSPGIFLEQEMPSVEVEVDVKAERLADTVFEITRHGHGHGQGVGQGCVPDRSQAGRHLRHPQHPG